MRPYGSNPRRDHAGGRGDQTSPWIPPMDGGDGGRGVGGIGNLADRLSGLGLGDGPDESLYQVMKAVEDAENTIMQQVSWSFSQISAGIVILLLTI
ncbi:hypothetical protein GW17_00041853 [Ensete ventricosum]|uniref:Uncharacterized protein n=1 Tax=Ensete ventricosum TaxID=4639 RepID=A0A427AXF5_ENSVE|nr:hypothetical protein B296_00016132 [Ensete ventricosum]RWV95519.1 hypothetical protein GW17_00041853 [Ensete ventricosum]